jgi:CheY-like chemotaxis protein
MVNASTIRILIVNDQEEVGMLWKRLLSVTPGMNCVGFARDGESSLEMVKAFAPDVVLMDVMMPGIGGLEATRLVRQVAPETVIIVYSAHTGMSEKAFQSGADEFILMPISPDKLISTIRRVYQALRTA